MKKLLVYSSSLFIMIVLFPFSVFSYDQNIDSKIQELKSAQYKKMRELSKLADKIDKKNQLVHSITSKISLEISHLAIDKNEQERTNAIEAAYSSLNAFGKTLLEAINSKKNVKQFFVKELFKNDNSPLDFDKHKLIVIRAYHEQVFLKILVERYEECQQELIEINQKLSDLNK
jgi:hypothetical protein